MKDKKLKDSLEKIRDQIIEEDEILEKSKLSQEKEDQILKFNKTSNNNKRNFLQQKKVWALAACLGLFLLISPVLLSQLNLFRAGYDINSIADTPEASEEAITEDKALADVAPSEGSEEALGDGTIDVFEIEKNPNKKLIYTFSYDFQTINYQESISMLTNLVKSHNGYIETSQIDTFAQNKKHGYYTIRIPKDSSEAFQKALGNLGVLTNQSMSSEDVTKAYNNLETNIKILETKQARYIELLQKAESMEDILTIESALTDVEGQLKYLKEDLMRYDSDVNYNFFKISILEVEKTGDPVNADLSFGQKVLKALSNSLTNFALFIEGLVLLLANNIILLGFILIVVLIAAYIIRKRF